MPNVQKQLIVPYTTTQMYELVNDIQAYPEYLPWCSATEIHQQTATYAQATIHLTKGPLTYSITTENSMEPNASINMKYIAGPFKSCEGCWQFIEKSDTESIIKFAMDYQFKNMLTAMAIEPVFNPIANSLIDAFLQRAALIYGS